MSKHRLRRPWVVSVTWATACLAYGCHSKPEAKAPPTAIEQPAPTRAIEPPPPPVEAANTADAEALRLALLGKPKGQETTRAEPSASQRRNVAVVYDDEPNEERDTIPTNLSDGMFQSTIGDWDGAKDCLALTKPRTTTNAERGAMLVQFEIKQDGSVLESKALTEDGGRPGLGQCIERRAKRLRFPAFAGNSPVRKEAKFVY